jgi:hypothetical protein
MMSDRIKNPRKSGDFFIRTLAILKFFGNLYNVNTTPSKLPEKQFKSIISNLFSSDHPYESHLIIYCYYHSADAD